MTADLGDQSKIFQVGEFGATKPICMSMNDITLEWNCTYVLSQTTQPFKRLVGSTLRHLLLWRSQQSGVQVENHKCRISETLHTIVFWVLSSGWVGLGIHNLVFKKSWSTWKSSSFMWVNSPTHQPHLALLCFEKWIKWTQTKCPGAVICQPANTLLFSLKFNEHFNKESFGQKMQMENPRLASSHMTANMPYTMAWGGSWLFFPGALLKNVKCLQNVPEHDM